MRQGDEAAARCLSVTGFMALAFGVCAGCGTGPSELRAPAILPQLVQSPTGQSPSWMVTDAFGRARLSDGVRPPVLLGSLFSVCGTFSWLFLMFPGVQDGQHLMHLPPRWDPSVEQSLPFRVWMQDLMLWTICTDMEPRQQCAAIISQHGGPARDLARTITPQEVYNGGVISGVRLDPVNFLLHAICPIG